MKRVLALLLALLIPTISHAQNKAASHIWETAAYGEIPGITRVRLEGWNPAITSTFETVWPESSLHVPATAALSSPACISSSANDAAAGTGARTITLSLINTSYAASTETLTLNGTTAVSLTTTNVLAINKIEVATAGSGGLNAGTIDCGVTCAAGDCTTVYNLIPVSSTSAIPAANAGGGNISASAVYTVPASYSLLCKDFQIGNVFATVGSGVMLAIDGYTNLGLMKRHFIQFQHNSGGNPSITPGMVKFPAKTQINVKLAGVTGSNVGPASFNAECLLISDDWHDTAQDLF